MKCPKCGNENPDGTIFCEKCDWQISKKYKGGMEPTKKVTIVTYIAVVFGLAALIVSLLKFGPFGIAFGAIGMVASSYSMTVVRAMDFEPKTKKIFLVVTIAALAVSAIGFIFGLYYTVK